MLSLEKQNREGRRLISAYKLTIAIHVLMVCSWWTLEFGSQSKMNEYLSSSEDSKLDWTDDKCEPDEETEINKERDTGARREIQQ